MKNRKCIISLALILLISATSLAQRSSFAMHSEKPKPGEKVMISYTPGSELKKAKKITLLVHAYHESSKNIISFTQEVFLKKKANKWVGEFALPKTEVGALLRFVEGGNYENTDPQYFPVFYYNKDGKPMKGAYGTLAIIYDWFHALKIIPEPDPKMILKLYDDEFALYSENKGQDYLFMYHQIYSKIDKNKATEFMNSQISYYEKTLTQSYDDLLFLQNLYIVGGMSDKASKTNTLLIEKYPDSSYAKQLKRPARLPTVMDTLRALLASNKYEEAYKAIKNNPKITWETYNVIVWPMYEKSTDLPLAKKIAWDGMQLIEAAKQLELSKEPPTYLSKNQYIREVETTYGRDLIDTYGAILLKLGENEEALKYMKQAYEMFGKKENEVNERYAQALLANGKDKEASEVRTKKAPLN